MSVLKKMPISSWAVMLPWGPWQNHILFCHLEGPSLENRPVSLNSGRLRRALYFIFWFIHGDLDCLLESFHRKKKKKNCLLEYSSAGGGVCWLWSPCCQLRSSLPSKIPWTTVRRYTSLDVIRLSYFIFIFCFPILSVRISEKYRSFRYLFLLV